MQKLNQLKAEEEVTKKSLVVVQSEEELKTMYSDPTKSTTQDPIESKEQVIASLTADFNEPEAGNIKNVLEFFFRN